MRAVALTIAVLSLLLAGCVSDFENHEGAPRPSDASSIGPEEQILLHETGRIERGASTRGLTGSPYVVSSTGDGFVEGDVVVPPNLSHMVVSLVVEADLIGGSQLGFSIRNTQTGEAYETRLDGVSPERSIDIRGPDAGRWALAIYPMGAAVAAEYVIHVTAA